MLEKKLVEVIDRLQEMTAFVAALQSGLSAVAQQVPNRQLLLSDYDTCTAALHAAVQGRPVDDQYLAHLEAYIPRVREFLNEVPRTP